MDRYEELFSKYDFDHLDRSLIQKNVDDILSQNFKKYDVNTVYSNILSCIDLTSLNSNDTNYSITSLVENINSFDDEFEILPHPAALCVYPAFVQTVKDALQEDLEIATVIGFPHSNTFVEVKIAEIGLSIMDGATEIDVVMPLSKFCSQNYGEVYDELVEIKSACQTAKLKVILESGLIDDPVELKKAAILAMVAGADFIKTSTGKGYKGATLEDAYVMASAIKEFNEMNNRKVGLKISGGVSDTATAVSYYTIAASILGEEWMNSSLFRIGASRLTNKILSSLAKREVEYF